MLYVKKKYKKKNFFFFFLHLKHFMTKRADNEFKTAKPAIILLQQN